MAKTYKKNGNNIETYETEAIVSESISTLEAERQGCLNTIEAMNVRIAEIDILLGAENMYRLDTGDNIQSALDRW